MEEIRVAQLARLLELRRLNRRTVLFLGARAGGFYRNSRLYQFIEQVNPENITFAAEDAAKKFRTCHKILSGFSELDAYDLLIEALKGSKPRQEDDYLVHLVKEGFFSVIMSTNIDRFLETAFHRQRLEDLDDYHVLLPDSPPEDDIMHRALSKCTLIKAFGDLHSRTHTTFTNKFTPDARLKGLLEQNMRENVLMIGYDPTWDEPFGRIIPETGRGDLWYINEEPPPEHSTIAAILASRQAKQLIGEQESYEGFIHALHSQLLKTEPPTSETHPDPGPSQNVHNEVNMQAVDPQEHSQGTQEIKHQQAKATRKKVFISYSHEDKRYLEKLHRHLTSFAISDIWYDKNILPGAKWQEEIKTALAETRVAILLVSANFLSSSFIMENELPQLLTANQEGDVTIIVVNVEPSGVNYTELAQFQHVNSPDKPLSSMKPYQRDEIWKKVAKTIKEMIS